MPIIDFWGAMFQVANSLIKSIPDALWGVLVGSSTSLIIVLLTNRANDKRLRDQFAHERELEKQSRELSLRRDIYLEAAETISLGLAAIGQFSNLDIPAEKLNEKYIEKSAAIVRAHIVAKEKTLGSIAVFIEELSVIQLTLFAKRVPLLKMKQALSLSNEQMERSSKERDRILTLMKDSNLQGISDPHRWHVMKSNFDFEGDRLNTASGEHARLATILYEAHLKYVQECNDESVRLRRLLIQVLFDVREELHLPIDEKAYLQIVEKGIKKQEDGLAQFLSDIRALQK